VKVEETLPELSDKEETIKAYLERDETLTSDILDEILLQLWHSEPFKSRGFVLDGFPNNDSHAQYLVERGLLPDAVIILKLEDEDVIKRLLPARFKAWKDKMNAKKERKKQRVAKKKEKLVKKEKRE
jgi:adenylate/nucleoside-diphosphate kinase